MAQVQYHDADRSPGIQTPADVLETIPTRGKLLSSARQSRRARPEVQMTKHSRRERERRSEETARVAEIQAAWASSVPPETAKAFANQVAAERARPAKPHEDMAPGTAPRPPRPGHEPKPPKEPQRSRRGG
jgi:hypothetical protein